MNQVINYNVTDAALAELSTKFKDLTVTDTASRKTMTAAIKEVRGVRLKVEEHRKELKADALEWGRKVDAEAKRITEIVKKVEDDLTARRKVYDDERERIKKEKEEAEAARVAEIRNLINSFRKIPFEFNGCKVLEEFDAQISSLKAESQNLDKEVYAEFYGEAFQVIEETIASLYRMRDEVEHNLKAEEERKAALAAAEADRKAREEAEAKMAEMQRKLDEIEAAAKPVEPAAPEYELTEDLILDAHSKLPKQDVPCETDDDLEGIFETEGDHQKDLLVEFIRMVDDLKSRAVQQMNYINNGGQGVDFDDLGLHSELIFKFVREEC